MWRAIDLVVSNRRCTAAAVVRARETAGVASPPTLTAASADVSAAEGQSGRARSAASACRAASDSLPQPSEESAGELEVM